MTDAIGIEPGFESLFNGNDLHGWSAIPRVYTPLWIDGPEVDEWMGSRPEGQRFPPGFLEQSHHRMASWSVEDGAIVGRQNEPGGGFGGFLITDRAFGDFELRLEAKPDWPADSGILVRKPPTTWRGIQILLDHRKSGSIGGFYGNGIGGFSATSFKLDAEVDVSGAVMRLFEEDPTTTLQPGHGDPSLLDFGISADAFLELWRPGDWNDIGIRVEGRLPVITTSVNGGAVARIDLSRLSAPHYDAEATAALLGREGRIALEVHDTDPMLGAARWGHDAACRWRSIRIRPL
jgi:hypothetical protein